ncbi:MAG TPA: hypothetical protein VG710_11900 [Opitutus sp.]|nr:hypothetical protein [Opitutus sp.]
MKTSPFRFARRSTLVVAAGLLGLGAMTSCSKSNQEKINDSVKDAYNDSKAAMSKAWDNAKDYTFDKRDEFTASAKAMSSKMEAQLSEVRANYSEAKASASRKAAMEELKDSEADYKEKVAALGRASADTWDSAKQNVIHAWDRVEAAYDKARAN